MPGPLAAAGSPACSVTVSSASAVEVELRSARGATVLCLRPGSYPGLELGGVHQRDVTVQPVPGAPVSITPGLHDSHGEPVAVDIAAGSSHIVVHGLQILGTVELEAGASLIRIDHNDITGGAFGVLLASEDCRTPNAPSWSGCGPEPKIFNVIVSGNRIHDIGGQNGDDALNVNNYANLRITGNELFGMREGGNHTDCFQSTFGGSGLVFDHNYEHDNNCQGFFTKDGDVADAIIYDNLFVRDQVERQAEANLDITNVYKLIVRNNTSWPGTSDLLRDIGSAQPPHATVDHNVFDTFANGCCGERSTFALTERDNILGHGPSSFTRSRSDQVGLPKFMNPSADDYRLARNPKGIGIDWLPSNQHYGT